MQLVATKLAPKLEDLQSTAGELGFLAVGHNAREPNSIVNWDFPWHLMADRKVEALNVHLL